ncbi:MAG: hypothetical protein U0841_09070 [Chloroflexia bacterium]
MPISVVRQLPWLVHNFLARSQPHAGDFRARGELLIARQGVGILQSWLIDLLLLESGRIGGGLHLNRFLTDEQRDLLASSRRSN